jgi:glycosyltransferase involved in cell wall biosynthesis
MDIINLIQCTELGGTERASLQLMTGLKRMGHSCRVISLNPLGRLLPILHDAQIPALGFHYRGPGGLFSLPRLYARLQKERGDALIMTGHNLFAMMALGDIGKERRLLAVHHHHRGEKPDWQWRLIYRWADKTFKAITFPSDFIKREAELLHPPIALKSHTIRNPIEMPSPPTPDQRRAARETLGIPQQAKVIGNAGWLIPRKRFDIFLRVAAQVVREQKDTVVVIAGDGPEQPKLKRLAYELGLTERVRWLGWREEMRTFYMSLDCLLFNSDWEALSMTALEAMSHCVPLVASIKHGGLGEIVTHEEHGILLENHDIKNLTNSVLRTFGNDGSRLALAGRRRVEQCCDFKSCVSSVEALITSH